MNDKHAVGSHSAVEAAGIEPVEVQGSESTSAQQENTKALQNNILDSSRSVTDEQESTPPIQTHNTSQQPKCVPAVYQNALPEDLAQIMAAWPSLSAELKHDIFELANSRKD